MEAHLRACRAFAVAARQWREAGAVGIFGVCTYVHPDRANLALKFGAGGLRR